MKKGLMSMRNRFKRFFTMVLAIVTFFTSIPLSNLTFTKADSAVANNGEEDDYYINVTIDLDGGTADDIYYESQVDRDGAGYSAGQWVSKFGAGKTFLDKHGKKHTVAGRGADDPCEGSFVVRADAIGVTPHVVIATPTKEGYTFAGWDTNASVNKYGSDDAFDVGCWNPGSITITALWKRDTANMTVYYDSGVKYVGSDGYSDDYDFTYSGQDHNFPLNSTLQTNVHLKDGFNMVGFQEDAVADGFVWNGWKTNPDYPNVYFDSWTMDTNRSIKVITNTTLSFEYDEGFENTAHTETVQTDDKYYDYPKLKQSYELDYVEDLDTEEKWYTYDGRNNNGSYIYWTANRPRRVKYHSKLKESAKNTLNLDQNGATTKGTERVDVYQGVKIDDITIPKKEYTATFFDGNKKVHDDIINKFKFLGYWNDTKYVWEKDTTGYADFFETGLPNDSDTVDTINGNYGDAYYFDLYSEITGTASTANFTGRLNTYNKNLNTWMNFSIRNTPSQKIRVSMHVNGVGIIETEDGTKCRQYSFELSSNEEVNVFVGGNVEIYFYKETSGNAEFYMEFPQKKELTTGYWYDENGKGLIEYPLSRNHTITAKWSGDNITLPEAPEKEGYTFVGWRTEDAKLMTSEWGNDDSDYLDCKNNYGGDVAKWFKASREGKTNYDVKHMYLVPNSYYLNDEVMHFQWYYVYYAGDEVGLSKNTKFIACYDEIPKVTVKFESGSDNTSEYNQKYDLTVYEGQSLKIPEESASYYKGRKYVVSFDNKGIGTTPDSISGNAPFDYWNVRSGIDEDADEFFAGETIPKVNKNGILSAIYKDVEISNLPILSADGYIFEGWYEDADYTIKADKVSIDGYGYNALDEPELITLYAKWKKTSATLRTVGEEGIAETNYSESTQIEKGSIVRIEAKLSKGYVFKGWYNGDVIISNDLSFDYTMPDEDTVLTAKAEPKWYVLTFDPNGGILKNPGDNLYPLDKSRTNYVYTQWNKSFYAYMTGDIPTRTGYRFAGWYLGNEAVFSKTGYALYNTSLFSYDTDYHWRYDGNVTVKADWEHIKYTVKYATTYGTGSIPDEVYNYRDEFILKDGNAFKKDGYEFDHYFVRRESDNKVYCVDGVWHSTDESDSYGNNSANWYDRYYTGKKFTMDAAWVRTDTTEDETFTFWAFPKPCKYTVTYYANGGNHSDGQTKWTDTATYDTKYDTWRNGLVRNGYEFIGWNTKANGTGTWWATKNEKGTNWTQKTDGLWYFTGIWNTDNGCPLSDIDLYAVWKPVEYSITYNLDGGIVTVKNPISYTIETNTFTLNNPVKAGYSFVGWTGSNGTTPQKTVTILKGSMGNKTYTANWVKDKTIKFKSVGHAGEEYNSKLDVSVAAGKSYKIPEESVNYYKGRGYTVKFNNNGIGTKPEDITGNAPFDYWNVESGIDEDADGFYAGETILKVNRDGILRAEFNDIKFSDDDLPKLTATGYIFRGWYTDEGLNHKASDGYLIDGNGYNVLDKPEEVTLYAKWEASANQYTVEHYLMNFDGKYDDVASYIDTYAAKTAESVTPPVRTFEGFTSPETQTVTVKPDGSTVIKYYYTRNKYILDLNSWIDNTKYSDLLYYTEDENGNRNQFIAAKATVKINGVEYAKDVTDYESRYVFYGSEIEMIITPETGHTIVKDETVDYTYNVYENVATIKLTMPASDKEVAPVLFTDSVKYVVNHYLMNLDGKTYTLTDTYTGKAKANHYVTPAVNSYEGFTSPNTQNVRIKADGSTVINYYYTRNQYYLNLNGYLQYKDRSEDFTELVETVKNLNNEDVRNEFATAIVKVNGEIHENGNNVTDFYEKVLFGSTYEVITTAKTGYTVIDNTETLTGVVEAIDTETGNEVKPHVKVNSYTIKFEPNKPSKATEDISSVLTQDVYYNREYNLKKNEYSYIGYEFIGWNTKADGTGTAYKDEAVIKNLTDKDNDTVTLYAQWKIHKWNINVYVKNEKPDGTFENETLWKSEELEYNTEYNYTIYKNDKAYEDLSTNGTMPDNNVDLHLTALRKQYTVTVNGDSHITNTTGSGRYRYEYEPTISAEVEVGYHFLNWNNNSSLNKEEMQIKVLGDITYTAYTAPNTDTKYTVKHYQMNLDGTTYTLADTENFTGVTDKEVTPKVKKYEGFTSPEAQTVTIKGDGSTVVEYYYTRNKRHFNIRGYINNVYRDELVDIVTNPVTGEDETHIAGTMVVTINGEVKARDVLSFEQDVYYGSKINIVTTTKDGYITHNENLDIIMPKSNHTQVIIIESDTITYTVRHWKKNVNTDTNVYDENVLDEKNYSLADTEVISGKAYSWVTPVIKTYEGFTYKATLPSEGTAYIKPDGSTVIDVYYSRNKYVIDHTDDYLTDVEYGNGIKDVSGLNTYEYEQEVMLTANLKTGYHWHDTDDCISSIKYPTGWYSRDNSGVEGILKDNTTYESQSIKFNMPARDVKLGVKATNNSYTVVYNENRPTDPSSLYNVQVIDEIKQEFIYNESQNIATNKFNLAGYTRKLGWMTKPSTDGNGTADYAYGETVINLTDKNLDVINLYAIWEDNAPEMLDISSTNNFADTQTVTLYARDLGSGVAYISFTKDTEKESYEKVTCSNNGVVTVTKTINDNGTYVLSAKDKNGKVSKTTITFYKTTWDTNKNHIIAADGLSVVEADFTSVPTALSTKTSINTAGSILRPVTSRDGVDFLGWNTSDTALAGNMSITVNSDGAYYAVWIDNDVPVAVLDNITSDISATQTITFSLYDTAEKRIDTGSDIKGYYIGTNPKARLNEFKSVTSGKDGSFSGKETVTLDKETTYYIFPVDKAGNIGDTIKLNGGNGLLFHRVDFDANGTDESPATVNVPYAVIPHGSTITLPTAYRLGYHDASGNEEQTEENDGKTGYWGNSKTASVGFNILKVDKDYTVYALWKANKYAIILSSNKPMINNGYRANSFYKPTGDKKIIVTYDEEIPFENVNNPSLTGWTFKGYANTILSTADNNESKELIDISGQKFNLQFVKDWYEANNKEFSNITDITLYAAWSENKYTVNYDTVGGTALKNSRVTHWYEESFTLPKATGDYYDGYKPLDTAGKAITTYRPGHIFMNWICDGTVYVNGGTAERLIADNNGECTIKAVWKTKKTVTLNITSDTFRESMTNDYAALIDKVWASKGTDFLNNEQETIKEYTFTKSSDIVSTK
jgi:uncharacterized repeat protein (TIGR02543 family)